MDIEKIFVSNELEEREIEFEGQKLKVKIRSLTWAQKSAILHKCLKYTNKGEASFDYGRYAEDMLVVIVAEAPWGVTDHLFLKRIKPAFGEKLEKLIPPPFEGEKEEADFFAKT